MSLPQLVPEQFVTVFMSTRLNEIRLADEPPLLGVNIADDMKRQMVEDGKLTTARLWDIYRDIVQLSFHHNGHCTHFMLCDDPQWDTTARPPAENEHSTVKLYDDEEVMMREAFGYIRDIFGPETNEGSPMFARMLVGWRMYIEIWPILINRALRYRLPIYRDMRTQPDTKWPTTRHLADISTLYLQGGGGFRKLPGLPDLLRFWGFWKEPHCPLPEDIAVAVCDDPFGVAKHVELYLHDMHNVMCMYYGIEPDTKIEADPLTGLAVPGTNGAPPTWPR